MTRDALYKRVARQIKKCTGATSGLVVELTADQNDSEVSSLTSPSTRSSSDLLDNEDTDEHEMMDCSARRGRPKGSTNQKKRDDANKFKECVNAIAHANNNELTKQRGLLKKHVKGFLEQVIQEKKEEFGVSDNISIDTVRSLIKRGSLAPIHRGTTSPLHNAELALVEICIHMGKICQPLTGQEATMLMNDMI